MTTQRLVKTSAILLFACGVLFPLSTKSLTLPFDGTPDGFLSYLNTAKEWQNGSVYKFIKVHPQTCEVISSIGYFECTVDYIETSSLGERACINVVAKRYSDNSVTVSDPKECGSWNLVKSPPSTMQSAPLNISSISVPRDLIAIFAGAGLVLLGGGFGLLMSRLINHKK